MARKCLSGLDVIAARGFRSWRKERIAVLTHQSAVTCQGRHLLELLELEGVRPLILLSPEHGLWGRHQGMESVESMQDPLFSFPVLSLYGRDSESLAPRRDWLEGIDRLVVDMQDVGARYYTFAATLAKSLRISAQTGTRVTVLDRPNPIGGTLCEGTPPLPEYTSYVGELMIPHRHGLTLGELARWVVKNESIPVDLEVVPVKNWRGESWSPTSLWVPPSPNMPTVETALVYPGLCLLEGTNLSEGRGTTTPFLLFGAPFLDARALAHALSADGASEGCTLIPNLFRPMFGKWAGSLCQGIRIHVHSPETFRPLRLGTAILRSTWELHPAEFAWRTETYEFETQRLAVDLLFGDPAVRKAIEEGRPLDTLLDMLNSGLPRFIEESHSIWLYPRVSR